VRMRLQAGRIGPLVSRLASNPYASKVQHSLSIVRSDKTSCFPASRERDDLIPPITGCGKVALATVTTHRRRITE